MWFYDTKYHIILLQNIFKMILIISKSNTLLEFDSFTKLNNNRVSDFDIENIIINIYRQEHIFLKQKNNMYYYCIIF